MVAGHFGRHAEDVAGSAGEMTFGPDHPGSATLAYAAYDVFIARFEPDGAVRWARRVTGDGHELGGAVAAAPDGSSIVTIGRFGVFGSTTTAGEGQPRQRTLTAAGAIDSFIAAYDGDGGLLSSAGSADLFAARLDP